MWLVSNSKLRRIQEILFAEMGLEKLWLVVVLPVISLPSSRLGSPACTSYTMTAAL